ncbi:MAG TPA: iron ABC transporter permease, partial [Acetobacteraceae bacterium]
MRKGAADSRRGAWPWLAAGWASVLLLPWYGVEGWAISAWLEHSGAALPAIWQGFSGRPWLLPLLLPLVLGVFAGGSRAGGRRPRLLVAAGVAGLLWLVLEAGVIGGRGEPALGWGALVYAVSALMLAAQGLAWQGWCRGDAFITGSIGLVCGAILVFVGYPVGCILLSAFRDNAGHLDIGLFAAKISDSSIWGLGCLAGRRGCGVAWNSLAQATLVGLLTTLLGLAFALVSARTRLPFKGALRLISVLPVITPPFVIGMALILLFGRAGIVTGLLQDLFDIPRSRWIYGMAG